MSNFLELLPSYQGVVKNSADSYEFDKKILRLYKLTKVGNYNKEIHIHNVQGEDRYHLSIYTENPKLLDPLGYTIMKFKNEGVYFSTIWKLIYKSNSQNIYSEVLMEEIRQDFKIHLKLSLLIQSGVRLEYEWRYNMFDQLSFFLFLKGSKEPIMEYNPGKNVDTLSQFEDIIPDKLKIFLLSLGHFIKLINFEKSLNAKAINRISQNLML